MRWSKAALAALALKDSSAAGAKFRYLCRVPGWNTFQTEYERVCKPGVGKALGTDGKCKTVQDNGTSCRTKDPRAKCVIFDCAAPAPTSAPTLSAPPTLGAAKYICRNDPAKVRSCESVCNSEGKSNVGEGKFKECTATGAACTKKQGPEGVCSVCDCETLAHIPLLGTVTVAIPVEVLLEGIDAADINDTSIESVVNLFEKVMNDLIPEGATARVQSVAGIPVSRRMLLQGAGVSVEFEIVMEKSCDSAVCDSTETDEISASIYQTVTTDLQEEVESGELTRKIQEEAVEQGVPALSQVTVDASKMQISDAKVTVTGGPSSSAIPSQAPTSTLTHISSPPSAEPSTQLSSHPSNSVIPSQAPTLAPTSAPIRFSWIQRGGDIDGEADWDESGSSVALSSDGAVLAIGAPRNAGNSSDTGHVRVYSWDAFADAWVQRGVDLDGVADGEEFGGSVSLSSDGAVLAIGAPINDDTGDSAGHVRVYSWDASAGSWVRRGEDLDGEAEDDRSGTSVSLSGDGAVLAIGALSNDGNGRNAGHVRVYSWDASAGSWVRRGEDLDGEAEGDGSGRSISLSGDGAVLAVGALGNDGNGCVAGHVRVYWWDALAGAWSRRGDDLDGEAEYDRFGASVALSSDGAVLAVGAPGNDAGYVRVYSWDAPKDEWVQRGDDLIGEAEGDDSGRSLALSSDGTILAVGAIYNKGGFSYGYAGHVRVHSWDAPANAWVQRGEDVDGENRGDESGTAVALSGDGAVLAVGAPFNPMTSYTSNDESDEVGCPYKGHVRVYSWEGVSHTGTTTPGQARRSLH